MKRLITTFFDMGQTPPMSIGGLNSTIHFGATFHGSAAFSQSDRRPKIIVTPELLHTFQPGAAPVCTIETLEQNGGIAGPWTGFTARATNVSQLATTGSELVFNWIAIYEDAPPLPGGPVDLRMGTTVPKFYVPQNSTGGGSWWQDTLTPFAVPFGGFPPVPPVFQVLTATDPYGSFRPHAAAVAGSIRGGNGSEANSLGMAGLSADSAAGACAFNYLAAAKEKTGDTKLVVDTGEMLADFLLTDGPGEWSSVAVPFAARFDEPPLVLANANDLGLPSPSPPFVPVVSNITKDYFILSARHYTGSGIIQQPNFFWIAIGCGLGCGQGSLALP